VGSAQICIRLEPQCSESETSALRTGITYIMWVGQTHKGFINMLLTADGWPCTKAQCKASGNAEGCEIIPAAGKAMLTSCQGCLGSNPAVCLGKDNGIEQQKRHHQERKRVNRESSAQNVDTLSKDMLKARQTRSVAHKWLCAHRRRASRRLCSWICNDDEADMFTASIPA